MIRVGLGYDLHRLVAGRRLILGGVLFDFEKGEDGLYIFKNAALGEITRAVLPFPSISE